MTSKAAYVQMLFLVSFPHHLTTHRNNTCVCVPAEEDSLSPLPASETPPLDTPSPFTPVTAGMWTWVFKRSPSGFHGFLPSTLSEITTFVFPAPSSVQTVSIKASPPPTSLITSPSNLTTPTTPAATVPPLLAQAPPLILTQTAGGTFLLPAATGNTSILLTAQVGDARP